MNLCDQLKLHVLKSSGLICEKADRVIDQKSEVLMAELENMNLLLQRKSVSGTTVHDVANVRQRLLSVSDAIARKGVTAKHKKIAKSALEDALKIVKANIKAGDSDSASYSSKHSKNRKYNSVVSTFHNMY